MSKIKVGSARVDERGKYSGGSAGDQTGKEVSIQDYYVHSKGWYVLRPKDVDVANRNANAMTRACNNPNIGYDQGNRLNIVKHGTNTKTKTECDCSSLVRECVKEASGKDVGNFTTANEASVLESSGLFEKRKSVGALTKLYNGDVLVTKTQGHTVVVVSGRARKSSSKSKKYSGKLPKLPPIGYYDIGDGYKSYIFYDDEIKLLQKFLNWAIDAGLKVDGQYGEKTMAAVRKFQGTYRLTIDGKFGKKSLAKAKKIKK